MKIDLTSRYDFNINDLFKKIDLNHTRFIDYEKSDKQFE